MRIDSDQLAECIHQRAAGIAVIDGRIRLQEILKASRSRAAGRTAFGADDAHRYRLADAERVTNCERDVADPDFV